jgi:hypothetical protein
MKWLHSHNTMNYTLRKNRVVRVFSACILHIPNELRCISSVSKPRICRVFAHFLTHTFQLSEAFAGRDRKDVPGKPPKSIVRLWRIIQRNVSRTRVEVFCTPRPKNPRAVTASIFRPTCSRLPHSHDGEPKALCDMPLAALRRHPGNAGCLASATLIQWSHLWSYEGRLPVGRGKNGILWYAPS